MDIHVHIYKVESEGLVNVLLQYRHNTRPMSINILIENVNVFTLTNSVDRLMDLNNGTRAHTHTPVSYTHLDVYKRQEIFCEDGRGKVSTSWGAEEE